MKTKLLLLALVSTLFTLTQAQITIEGDKVISDEKRNQIGTKYKNCLSLDYFRTSINGNPTITYERYLTKHFTIETNVGMTYTSFYDGSSFDWFKIDYQPGFYKPRLGFSVGGGFRYYFEPLEMEKWYLKASTRYLVYKHTSGEIPIGELTVKMNDVIMDAGYKYHLGRVFMDFYLGLGARQAKFFGGNTTQPLPSKSWVVFISFGGSFGYCF